MWDLDNGEGSLDLPLDDLKTDSVIHFTSPGVLLDGAFLSGCATVG